MAGRVHGKSRGALDGRAAAQRRASGTRAGEGSWADLRRLVAWTLLGIVAVIAVAALSVD